MTAEGPSWGAVPTRHRLKGAVLREWAWEVGQVLRKAPGRTATLRRYRGRNAAWTARREWVERGLFPGVELRAVRLPDGGSAIEGRFPL